MTGPTVVPVTVTWHWYEEESVHDPGEVVAEPVPPDCDHDTLPVGEWSVTVATHAVDVPKRTVERPHVTVVLDGVGFTEMLNVPQLGRLFVSPSYEALMVWGEPAVVLGT